MLISNQSIFKSFAEQSAFSFNFDLSMDNYSGNLDIDFSGKSGSVNFFKINSGRIYNSNQKFINSYFPGQNFLISGNFLSGISDCYINNKKIYSSLNVCDSRYVFDSIYLKTTGVNCSFLYDLLVEKIPSFEIQAPSLYTLTGQKITGCKIINNTSTQNSSFKLFSGVSYLSNGAYILSNQSIRGLKISEYDFKYFDIDYINDNGIFKIESNGLPNPISGVIRFDTSFGEVASNIIIPLKVSDRYFINFSNYSSLILNKNYHWSYLLDRAACSGSYYSIKIKKENWNDTDNNFITGIKIITGSYDGKNYIESGNVYYDASSGYYIATGYLPSYGCNDGSTYMNMISVTHYNENNTVGNSFKLNIYGSTESFNYERLMKE